MDLKNITKKYTNGDITIVWKPGLCIHSKNCWKGLPEVFKPQEKPWIVPENADSQKIMEQIQKCPSGALSFFKNDEEISQDSSESNDKTSINKIEVLPNGPLLVHGNITVAKNGEITEKSGVTAFCRCGSSGNKPYCDGTHSKIDFKD